MTKREDRFLPVPLSLGSTTWVEEIPFAAALRRWQDGLRTLPEISSDVTILAINYVVGGNPHIPKPPKTDRFIDYFDDVNVVGVSIVTPATWASTAEIDVFLGDSLRRADKIAARGLTRRHISWRGREHVQTAIDALVTRLGGGA